MQNVNDIEASYALLGLGMDATDPQIRAAYLALVQKFPPDREPERFAEIHQAYLWLSDPMEFAQAVTQVSPSPPDLTAIVDAAERCPPRLTPNQLLSLGNVNP